MLVKSTILRAFCLVAMAFSGHATVIADELFVANSGSGSMQPTVAAYTTSGQIVNAALVTDPLGHFGAHVVASGTDLYYTDDSLGVIGKYTTSGATVDQSFVSAPGGACDRWIRSR